MMAFKQGEEADGTLDARPDILPLAAHGGEGAC
jgi:hypothetical protein